MAYRDSLEATRIERRSGQWQQKRPFFVEQGAERSTVGVLPLPLGASGKLSEEVMKVVLRESDP